MASIAMAMLVYLEGKATISKWPCSMSQSVSLPEDNRNFLLGTLLKRSVYQRHVPSQHQNQFLGLVNSMFCWLSLHKSPFFATDIMTFTLLVDELHCVELQSLILVYQLPCLMMFVGCVWWNANSLLTAQFFLDWHIQHLAHFFASNLHRSTPPFGTGAPQCQRTSIHPFWVCSCTELSGCHHSYKGYIPTYEG